MDKRFQESLPRLGFGLMRLPKDEKGGIDLPQVCDMVDACMEKGMNYFDTAYPYHNGESEKMIKEALVDRYPRDTFLLADKLPVWYLHSKEDVRRIFYEQLERTGAGYFDMYLLHAVDANHLISYDKFGCWSFLQEMKAQGLVRHIGFSFHDAPELLERVLTGHPETRVCPAAAELPGLEQRAGLFRRQLRGRAPIRHTGHRHGTRQRRHSVKPCGEGC